MSPASINETLISNVSVAPIFVNALRAFIIYVFKKIIFKWKWYINNIYVSHSEIGYSIIQNTKTQESIVSVAPKFCAKKYSRAVWLRECFYCFCEIKENREEDTSFIELVHPMLVKLISLSVLYRFKFLFSVLNNLNIFNRINYDCGIVLR